MITHFVYSRNHIELYLHPPSTYSAFSFSFSEQVLHGCAGLAATACVQVHLQASSFLYHHTCMSVLLEKGELACNPAMTFGVVLRPKVRLSSPWCCRTVTGNAALLAS
jgi:hypothetical protein